MVHLLRGHMTWIGPWSVRDYSVSAPGDSFERWSIKADVALRAVPRGSIDRCACLAACTCLHPQHDRYCVISGLLYQQSISQMVTSLGGLRCLWCHVLGNVVLVFLFREPYKVSTMQTSQFGDIVHFCR